MSSDSDPDTEWLAFLQRALLGRLRARARGGSTLRDLAERLQDPNWARGQASEARPDYRPIHRAAPGEPVLDLDTDDDGE